MTPITPRTVALIPGLSLGPRDSICQQTYSIGLLLSLVCSNHHFPLALSQYDNVNTVLALQSRLMNPNPKFPFTLTENASTKMPKPKHHHHHPKNNPHHNKQNAKVYLQISRPPPLPPTLYFHPPIHTAKMTRQNFTHYLLSHTRPVSSPRTCLPPHPSHMHYPIPTPVHSALRFPVDDIAKLLVTNYDPKVRRVGREEVPIRRQSLQRRRDKSCRGGERCD
jgi:hypothetical protein